MKVEYTKRALADLRQVAAESLAFGDAVAMAVQARLEQVVARIAEFPESATKVSGQPDLRVAPLVRYPYRIFYRVPRPYQDTADSPHLPAAVAKLVS